MDQQQHAKVERFLKLGYSHDDIVRVLESLRQDAQTNDILEELIKTCHTHNSPKLVPRGCSPGAGQARPRADREPAAGFRPVVIDGSNVAMSHGEKKVFSCRGLHLAVSWFLDRGVRDITVFVPLWRKEQSRPEAPITDQHILDELESRRILVYTPSRCVNGKRVVCYDDRYIIKLAFDYDGIIVSNDNYRDLQTENPQWKRFIEERLLMYTFANDKFMPPDDPLGRNGPTIDDFLRKKPWAPDTKPQHCPYGKKCTYGVKCKFYHPERANQSQLPVADELRAQRDRARNYSPKPGLQPEPRYAPPITPPLSAEDKLLRASPGEQFIYQRDCSSPRSLHRCPSSDPDEAFSSMDSSMSRLYIQDTPYSLERLHHSYSSGVPSCSLSHDGSYSGHGCSCGGYVPHAAQSRLSLHHYPPAWSSCPPLALPSRECPGQCLRQSHSLSRSPRVSPSSEQRTGLKHQLSTLFPQRAVERVMNDHPHVSDISKLITLIQSYRTSHISY